MKQIRTDDFAEKIAEFLSCEAEEDNNSCSRYKRDNNKRNCCNEREDNCCSCCFEVDNNRRTSCHERENKCCSSCCESKNKCCSCCHERENKCCNCCLKICCNDCKKCKEDENNENDDCVCNIIESIAKIETGLAHILNAEGEKLQKAIKVSDNVCDLLEVNKNVRETIKSVTDLELLLNRKLDTILSKGVRREKDCCHKFRQDSRD